jgi:hypothetical protein
MSSYFDNGGFIGVNAPFGTIFEKTPNILQNGLELWLDAGNSKSYPGSGTTWTNLANTNLNTTLSGTSFTSDAGGGIVFGNGNTGSIPSGLTFSGAGTGYTISVWLRHTGTVSTGRIQRYFTLEQEAAVLRHSNLSNSNLHAYSIDSGGTIRQINIDNQIFTDEYYNLVSVYNGSSIIVYRNGVEAGNVVTSFTLRTPSGAALSSTTEYFEGNMYIIKYYNRPLNSTEVTQNYDALKERFGL